MWATIGKYVGGKVLTAVLVVSVGASMIWFWRHPESLRAIWATMKGVLAWLGFVIVLPWSLCFATAKVVKLESNGAAAVLLSGIMLLDVLVAFWLGGWGFSGVLTWVVVVLGFLSAGVYNFLVCDFLAERFGDAT